jgi:hypothetical protein
LISLGQNWAALLSDGRRIFYFLPVLPLNPTASLNTRKANLPACNFGPLAPKKRSGALLRPYDLKTVKNGEFQWLEQAGLKKTR